MASEMRPAKVVGIDPETGDEYPIDTVQWAKDIRNATLDEIEKRLDAEMPCHCIDGYKDRKLIDPQCERHDFLDMINDMRKGT